MTLSYKIHNGTYMWFIPRILAGMIVACMFACGASAQTAKAPAKAPAKAEVRDPVEEEKKFAEGLVRMGMPDYATMVLSRIKGAGTDAVVKSLEVQSLASMGKFKEALDIIAAQPDQSGQGTWTMRLVVADSYFAWGKYTNAQAIYEGYFDRFPTGPSKDLNQFYIESAYKYAKMLQMMGFDKKSLAAYDYVMRGKLEKEHQRQIKSEQAELMVKLADKYPAERDGYLADAKKIAGDLMWIQDIFFGKAVVILAHIKMIQGDMEGAQKMLEDPQIKATLKQIDDALKKTSEEIGEDLTRFGPMAESMYLLGAMMHDEAEKLRAAGGDKEKIKTLLGGKEYKAVDGKTYRTDGAYQLFIKVFVNYPGTTWAPDAGLRSKKVEEILKRDYGAKITTVIGPEQLSRVEKMQFASAKVLFNQQQWLGALEAYRNVLKLYPEGEAAVDAAADVATCYIELQEEIMADTVVRYMAERFGRNPLVSNKAGDELLRLAEGYGQRNDMKRREDIYQMFFTHFDRHPRTPNLLLRSGDVRYGEKDYKGAQKYYMMVAQNYTNSTVYFDSLSRLALVFDKLGMKAEAIKTLEDAITIVKARPTPGQPMVDLTYRLGYQYKLLGPKQLPAAVAKFDEVIKMAADLKGTYGAKPEEKDLNKKLAEGAQYYKAQCRAMMTDEDKEKDKANKAEAAAAFAEFVAKYPKSDFAPSCLLQLGTLYTILEKPEDAQKSFDRIKKDYPNSQEVNMISYMTAVNLLKMGQREKAIAAFKEMFEGAGAAAKYSDGQILNAGHELFAADEFDLALQAFSRVVDNAPKERQVMEMALFGKAKTQIEVKKYQDGAKTLDQFFKSFTNSYYNMQALYYKSQALGGMLTTENDETKRVTYFNDAIQTLQRIRRLERTAGGRMKVDLAIAKLYEDKGDGEVKASAGAVRPDKKKEYMDKGKKYKGDALAMYQARIMLITPEEMKDPEVKDLMEEVYFKSMTLLADEQNWDKTYENAIRYIELYPNGKYAQKAREFRTTAGAKVDPSTLKKFVIEEDVPTNAPPAVTNAPAPAEQPEAPKPGAAEAAPTQPEAKAAPQNQPEVGKQEAPPKAEVPAKLETSPATKPAAKPEAKVESKPAAKLVEKTEAKPAPAAEKDAKKSAP